MPLSRCHKTVEGRWCGKPRDTIIIHADNRKRANPYRIHVTTEAPKEEINTNKNGKAAAPTVYDKLRMSAAVAHGDAKVVRTGLFGREEKGEEGTQNSRRGRPPSASSPSSNIRHARPLLEIIILIQ
jgi:hypothetical protein